jgi:hypothetical protein
MPMPRDMLCYCLNLTTDDIRKLWGRGYFDRFSEHHPGLYCTSCKGDLAHVLDQCRTALPDSSDA